MEFNIKEGWYQYKFLTSKKKFPCLISGIGSGKTAVLLLKIYKYCEEYPGTTALIVRREFTDLRDSTMKDFEIYFDAKVGVDKNYRLPNGSTIMFRHADEIAVLKNVNLGIAAIEQAEEFEDDKQFQYLRDRLRQKNGADYHPLCMIANSNGHNWLWRMFVNAAETVNTIDEATGQHEYIRDQYYLLTASSFANADNLLPDFLEDLRRKEHDAPNHFAQYVMNSFEDLESDDLVFEYQELKEARRDMEPLPGFNYKVAGMDVARFGQDKSSVVILEQCNRNIWRVSHVEEWQGMDLNYTTGRFVSIVKEHGVSRSIIDEDGIGSGVLDFLQKGHGRNDFTGFRNRQLSYSDNCDYGNPRTAAAFDLKKMIRTGKLLIDHEGLIQEMTTLKYKFMNDGRRILVSKDEMRRQGVASPNMCDSALMASTLLTDINFEQDRQYVSLPQYSREESLFGIAGIR